MRARGIRRPAQAAGRIAEERAELHHPMRVVAVGAFGVAIVGGAQPELRARFEQVRTAPVGRAAAVDEAWVAEAAADGVRLGA